MNKKPDKRPDKGVINYFVNYTSIFSLTPWRNSIQLFHEKGYDIRVFQYEDKRIAQHPSELEDKYTLFEIKYPIIAKYILYAIKVLFRSLKHIGLKRMSTVGEAIECLFHNYYYVMGCVLKKKCGQKEVFIGGDPGALIAAQIISKKLNGILIYWSLELYIEKHLTNFGLRHLKRMERRCNQDAVCTVDFGDIRCKILQQENRIPPEKMIAVANSQIGHGSILRSNHFNDKFNIPKDKVIILHAGALFGPWLHVKDIFQSVPEWPENYVLVLHTHMRPYPGCGFSIPEAYLNTKIFLSDEPVSFDQLDLIYSSCDIGIMVHGPVGYQFDQNLYYSDLSVGKMFHHLKVGVPLIVRNLPGYREMIEDKKAGVCIEGPCDILPSIRQIMENHEQYRKNALLLHEATRFDLHHAKLIEKIDAFAGR